MRLFVTPVLLLTALLGCSSGEAVAPPDVTAGNKDDLSFDTGKFQIPPGDSFECFYTSMITDHEINVIKSVGQQGPGGHHITVYYTDTKRAPTHHTCTDQEMVSWHMLSGADVEGSKEPIITVPDGVAFKLPADKQLVVQIHYINTTGAEATVDDHVTVKTLPSDQVKMFANFWTMVDTGFTIPANGTTTSRTTCTTKQDLKSLLLLGHMHELGKHYTLERLDETDKVVETIYDQEWHPEYASHPPTVKRTMDAPMTLPKGTRLRQTCTWDNTTAEDVGFPREMCVSFAVYFPDNGEIDCIAAPAP
jgi:hypothetical protein